MKDKKDSKMVRKAKMEHERHPVSEAEFEIDEGNLEKEAHRQIELMRKYGELHAQAKWAWERADNKKKSVRSRLILEVERDPSVLKGASKNMQTVEAYYRNNVEYKEACATLAERVYELELMQNAMFALAHRRDMLDLFNKRQMALNNINNSERDDRVKDRVKSKLRKIQKEKG